MTEKEPFSKVKTRARPVAEYFAEHPDYVWKWGLTFAVGIALSYMLIKKLKEIKNSSENKHD
ncbi:MAG: hypothetical protein A2W22_03230 [Candidatus Levybacteria bacterium RBG_16_35_11]|nr:MAG: hypothetical protein A2W22_03230 [Candidatus Levybacteria bacterium RBG_16_35_11]